MIRAAIFGLIFFVTVVSSKPWHTSDSELHHEEGKEITSTVGMSELCKTSWQKRQNELIHENATLNNEVENSRRKRTAILNAKWPGTTIPFRLEGALSEDEKSIILSAMVDFHTYTCVRFEQTTHDFVKAVLRISKNPNDYGCKSHVGYNTDRQVFFNSVPCLIQGTIQHELMHALGFDHEHKRPNRDEFVKVHLENVVTEDYYASFDKMTWKEVDKTVKQTRYDYGSVLHYAWDAFSKQKTLLKTLEPTDVSALNVMGQRTSMSYADVRKINIVYGCPDYKPTFAEPIADFGAPKNPFECNFDEDWCGWRQQTTVLMPAYYKNTGESVPKSKVFEGLEADDFDWWRFRNSTLSENTGPNRDVSGNGHYIYAESSWPRLPGHVGRISTPSFTAKKGHRYLCIKFSYHSFTMAPDTLEKSKLNVYLLGTNDDSEKVLQRKIFQSKDNDVKNEWQTAKIMLDLKKKQSGKILNVVFEVVIGENVVHDIAIDEYSLKFLKSEEKC